MCVTKIESSIKDVLATPIGTRVHRRDYGSNIHQWLDKPWNDTLKLEIISAVQESLEKFEPRIQLISIKADPSPEFPNKILVKIEAKTRDQAPIKTDILL